MKNHVFVNPGTLRGLRDMVHHQENHLQYPKQKMRLLTVGSNHWKRTASMFAIDEKTENLSFEGNVLRWTIPEHRSSRSYCARNGSIMSQRWRGLALVVHWMSSAARGIGTENIKSYYCYLSWFVYVLFYCFWWTRVYKKTSSYILKCKYIISMIWIIYTVEYTFNEVSQARYRIGLMDNVESRFARTRY